MELSLPLWLPWNSPIKLFKFCSLYWFCQTVFTTRHLPHMVKKSVIFFLLVFSLSFYMILIRWFILWFWSSLPHGTVFAFVASMKLSNQTIQILFIILILPNSFHHTPSTTYGKKVSDFLSACFLPVFLHDIN